MSPAPWMIAVTAPVFALAAWLLIRTIVSLVRAMRASVIASLPLRERVVATLPAAGVYDVAVEGRRFTRDFGGLDFALADRNGAAIPLRRSLVRPTVSSGSRVRMVLRSFQLAAPGEVALSIRGIRPQVDPDDHIVFARPIGATIVGHVLALIACAALTIGSLVATILLILRLQGRL